MSNASKFWALMKESVIFQGIITTAVVFSACYLWVTGRSIPTDLLQVLWAVLAFWGGSKLSLTKAK